MLTAHISRWHSDLQLTTEKAELVSELSTRKAKQAMLNVVQFSRTKQTSWENAVELVKWHVQKGKIFEHVHVFLLRQHWRIFLHATYCSMCVGTPLMAPRWLKIAMLTQGELLHSKIFKRKNTLWKTPFHLGTPQFMSVFSGASWLDHFRLSCRLPWFRNCLPTGRKSSQRRPQIAENKCSAIQLAPWDSLTMAP